MELLAPVANLAALDIAIEAGADAVYVGLKNDTNARAFAGINFDEQDLIAAKERCERHKVKLMVAINTFPQPGQEPRWHRAISLCADVGVDSVIMADPGLLAHGARHYPNLERHLSVQASAANVPTLELFHNQFGITRAVLPRVLDIHQVEAICADSPVEIEVFAGGSLCVMAEGRCQLSHYVSGHSPNSGGACSPGAEVSWHHHNQHREVRLSGTLLDRVEKQEAGGYPTVCKGQFVVSGQPLYPISRPCSLSTLPLLPRFGKAGVAALKIEGRQRSPFYSKQVTQIWRQAIDEWKAGPERYQLKPQWHQQLKQLAEGGLLTTGAYLGSWH
ncbi:ubiquinone anaerobic biosynthesis protein UbiU [Ferrimonas aestuarii]|uniref:U32 family peptidase n=1 Tax=Ferrimonas aestuarii TaxID=2569539 RepID=A0A4U1BHT0_9GAMM|nr:peptidase U32 family protein [Ferrimonas aestuarii]TKB49600.1 U32 family peptidase [Ferrimonas aestuarii]